MFLLNFSIYSFRVSFQFNIAFNVIFWNFIVFDNEGLLFPSKMFEINTFSVNINMLSRNLAWIYIITLRT